MKIPPLSFISIKRSIVMAALCVSLNIPCLNASIVHWAPANVTVDASAPPPFYYISMITGEVTQTPLTGEGVFMFGDGDVNSNPSAGFLSVDWTIIANRGQVPNDMSGMSPGVARFSFGDIIDGSNLSLWDHSFEVLQNNYATAPDWASTETTSGYIGLSLQISGLTHYGWASIARNGSNYTLYDFAYNSTPEESISAGTVPEPNTISAFMIAIIGFSAYWGFNRRFPLKMKNG